MIVTLKLSLKELETVDSALQVQERRMERDITNAESVPDTLISQVGAELVRIGIIRNRIRGVMRDVGSGDT